MSRQDKATSEKHTRTLRELVKRPENKVCADCKRNDPRWASWNLGVFLCIRCSGIHRSMGTHISKVKSVDLDIWTPEQMDSIQSWGNALANLYWEAHLKPGHIPADHKMESFIRSKYESRRWALEGPPPRDPSVLEGAREHYSEPAPPPPPAQQPKQQQPASASRLPPGAAAPQPPHAHGQRQSHTLLSAQTRSISKPPAQQPAVTAPAPVPAPAPAPAPPQDDLFSLDFHAPASSAPAAANGQKKDVKNDILSLFASSPPPGSGVMAGGGFAQAQQAPVQAQPTSMMGNTGSGMWGAQSGWNNPQPQPAQGNPWGQPQPQPQPSAQPYAQAQQQQFGAFGGAPAQPQFAAQNVWGGGAQAAPSGGAGGDLFSAPFMSTAPAQSAKKDDAFGDLWGGFK